MSDDGSTFSRPGAIHQETFTPGLLPEYQGGLVARKADDIRLGRISNMPPHVLDGERPEVNVGGIIVEIDSNLMRTRTIHDNMTIDDSRYALFPDQESFAKWLTGKRMRQEGYRSERMEKLVLDTAQRAVDVLYDRIV